MKRKRRISLLLMLLILGVLSGCTGGTEDAADREEAESDFLHYVYSEEAVKNRTYDISMEDAVLAVATAYLQKGEMCIRDSAG